MLSFTFIFSYEYLKNDFILHTYLGHQCFLLWYGIVGRKIHWSFDFPLWWKKKIKTTPPKYVQFTLVFIAALFVITKNRNSQMNICGMDKQNVKYHYKGRLFIHKKGRSSHSCYNIDIPWKHDTKWKSHTQKAAYCMIPFIVNVLNGPIHRSRK